ncbi:unnamed protein product [Calicophoron daubneyi]|uniref:PH domain-containing protein n=1 Tax=Calicophoron daubneyi TaxID=300641 RepID=A0AAV2T848_CALDB
MRFNHAQIGPVSAQWNSVFEGILLCKQKIDSRRRHGVVFSEHWCRLKGNILVLCRSPNRTCVDVDAVIFLERFTVARVHEEDVPYAFRLNFDAGDAPVVLIARSDAEADAWCQHLKEAQLSPILRRIGVIREELKNATGLDFLDSSAASVTERKKISATDEVTGSSDPRGLEITLSCENLALPGLSSKEEPNAHIIVSICTPPETAWKKVGTTEVIEKCRNPVFLKTIYLRSDLISEKTRVRFLLLDLRDINSHLGVQIGTVITMADQLMNNPSLPMVINDVILGKPLPIQSPSGPARMLISSRRYNPSLEHKSQPNRNILALNYACDNLLSKRYSFQHTLGERMHVVEFMGESRLCFDFPVEYLKSLLKREHLVYDSLSRTGSSNPLLESLRKERLITMKQVLEQYEVALRHLVDCSGNGYKPCWARSNPRLDFVPTNLHINQIAVTDADGEVVSSQNIVSVGVFSVPSRSYKSGGLFRNVANTMGYPQPYPPTHLSVRLMGVESPIASTACLIESTSQGKAMSLLYRGAGLLAVLRADLKNLVQRLTARDQAGPLAERIQKALTNMRNIFNDPLLRTMEPGEAINAETANLFNLLNDMSSFDKLECASPTTAESEGKPINKPVGDRAMLLNSIDKAGERLAVEVDRTWDAAAERLWFHVFDAMVSLIKQEGTAEFGLTPAALVSEAERTSVASLGLVTDNCLTALSVIYDAFSYRHHACVCQALTSLLAGLTASIPLWNRTRWEQFAVCGILAGFEGLVSCFGNELGMIEDWAWAIEQLANLRIILRPSQVRNSDESVRSDSKVNSEFSNSGSDTTSTRTVSTPTAKIVSIHECELTVPWSVWTSAPKEIQSRGRVRFRIHPVSFIVGINEQQSLAEKFDKTGVQQAVNNQGLVSLELYFDRYIKHYGAPPKSYSNQDICDLLANIRHILTPPLPTKPVELLELASEIVQAFGGLRFTSCKSAKDRTAMSVTLEQARWLRNAEGMDESNFLPALKCIRSIGLRLENVWKNTGVRKYAFNRLQLLSFPRLYRPPTGTFAPGLMT